MRRCLVIDDSPLIRKVVRLVLERARITVDEAEDVDKGLEACKSAPPDVVLLDWLMPGKPWTVFVKGVQAMALPRPPRIVYCTTENDPIALAKVLDHGCDDVLIKPFLCDDLREKLGLTSTPAAA
jgi:two-component system chemotaxis response regulator CheY